MKPKLLSVVIWFIACAIAVFAQTTNFTYQGRLMDGGTPANGNYDLQFVLWTSLSGGTQVGSTQTINSVAVSTGVFSVILDFGANAFPGANRFLEISARRSGSSSFTLLTPRQPISSSPYAVRSLNAASADSVTVNGNPAFSVTGIGNFANSNTFTGVGAGAANTPDSGGNGSQNSFYGNNAGASNTLGAANSFFGTSAGSANTGDVNSFFGQRAGFLNTTGSGNSFFGASAGSANTTGSVNSFFGFGAGSRNTNGQSNTFIGDGTNIVGESTSPQRTTLVGAKAAVQTGLIFNPINATAIGANALVSNSNSLVLGSINGINGATADTRVGIGTTAPTARLSVVAIGDGARVLHLGTERAWVFKQLGTGATTALELTADDPNNNNKNFVINTAGNVGIGTTVPDQRLSVNGNASKSSGGTSWAVFSDERLKNIKGTFAPGLKTLLQLRPIRFEYKRDNELGLPSGVEELGFSAQEVEKVLPEAVSRTQQGYLQLHSDPIMLTMLNAIKEQQALIQKQSELIESQRALAVRQQQQINALRRAVVRRHRRATR